VFDFEDGTTVHSYKAYLRHIKRLGGLDALKRAKEAAKVPNSSQERMANYWKNPPEDH
jgi:hypothetical protein